MEDDENGVPGLKISSIVTMSGQNTVDNTDESSQPSEAGEEGSNSKSNGGENNVSFFWSLGYILQILKRLSPVCLFATAAIILDFMILRRIHNCTRAGWSKKKLARYSSS